jgi:hypothetical protein
VRDRRVQRLGHVVRLACAIRRNVNEPPFRSQPPRATAESAVARHLFRRTGRTGRIHFCELIREATDNARDQSRWLAVEAHATATS